MEPTQPLSQSRTLVVVPVYNECDNVAALAEAIPLAQTGVDVLFVDDNSPDGTGDVLDALASKDPHVQVLHRPTKNGLGPAYLDGFAWALSRDYDFIAQMDGDFSHNPADIPRLLAAVESADVALGSRYNDGRVRVVNWPWHRLLLSKAGGAFVRLVSGLPIADPTAGFKCFRRAVLETITPDSVQSNGYAFNLEVTHAAWSHGFVIEEVPIIFVERQRGRSKMTLTIILEAMWIAARLPLQRRSRRQPLQPHPRSVAVSSVQDKA